MRPRSKADNCREMLLRWLVSPGVPAIVQQSESGAVLQETTSSQRPGCGPWVTYGRRGCRWGRAALSGKTTGASLVAEASGEAGLQAGMREDATTLVYVPFLRNFHVLAQLFPSLFVRFLQLVL